MKRQFLTSVVFLILTCFYVIAIYFLAVAIKSLFSLSHFIVGIMALILAAISTFLGANVLFYKTS